MKIRTHFSKINSYYMRQQKRTGKLRLISNNPWWTGKWAIGFHVIDKIETVLHRAVNDKELVLENVVHRSCYGYYTRDRTYFWCSEFKFALCVTRFEKSSPHFLEVVGDVLAAIKFLQKHQIFV